MWLTTEGYKDILSITVGANETSKFWLGMLNDLKNRGVKDLFDTFVTLDILAKALERTNPDKGNTEKVWKDKKISEALYHL